MAQFISPTGSTIVGTKEIVFARANVSGIDPATGEPIYSGDTTVFWDEQRTVRKAGKILFLDEDGDEWTFDQLKEPGEEDGEPGTAADNLAFAEAAPSLVPAGVLAAMRGQGA